MAARIENILIFFIILSSISCAAQKHPGLTLDYDQIEEIRANVTAYPLFHATLKFTESEVNSEIESGIHVPIPKDMAGGYTHERHKRNFFMLQKAGNLYQITANEKYAIYARDMLMEYAKMYPTLDVHPTKKSYATGKIFWQCLNDANWLVYASQAYDCIYTYLTKEEIVVLEKDLFRPMADFLSIGNPKFFNRIHNHSTWGNAAVGMIGLAMGDEELVNRALYGLPNEKIDIKAMDNDGGLINNLAIKERGFLAQLDYSFAPDGYFTEGPYYLRYAIFPFLIFGKALINKKPELDLLNYHGGILRKAVYALLNQTDPSGQFFPINDAQKGMSWNARELITAVDILYFYNKDPELLSIAEKQGSVLLNESGYSVAKDLFHGLKVPFKQKAAIFVDGPNGNKGGVGILRTDKADEMCLVMKYSAQGMGHGHFDKLSYSLYDNSGEVVQDYGAARWVNIDQKGGGRYLPENNTFAKQSIAHNTLVVNQTSHYDGNVERGEAHSPQFYYSSIEHEDLQVISSNDNDSYEDVNFQRTMILLKEEGLNNPLIIDILKVNSEVENQYDLPTWYSGHHLKTNFNFNSASESLVPLGAQNGYQHIWKQAQSFVNGISPQFTWYGNERFYTITSAGEEGDEIIFGFSGANDPNFNLRKDPVYIHRRKAKNTLFVSSIEAHGSYSTVTEIPLNPFPTIASIKVEYTDEKYSFIKVIKGSGEEIRVFYSHTDASPLSIHSINIDGIKYSWKGVISIQ